MTTPDLTIHGAGIFGLSIAWAAAKRGAKVRVLDVAHPGAGSSGGLVGALAPHVPELWNSKKAFQLDSLLMAESWWADVQATGGVDPLYARSGRLQPILDSAALALAHTRTINAETLWQGRAAWQVIPATGAAWEPHSPTGWLVHDTLTARLHPRAALKSLLAALHAKGVEFDGAAYGPQIWATGYAGLMEMSQGRPRPVGSGDKGQSAAFLYDAGALPQVFTDGLHIIGHGNGTVAIGSTTERYWDDPTSTDAQLEALIARARAVLPCLQDAPVIDRWAAIRPRSRTRAPMLGPWPNRPGHFIANGGFKIGYGMAPAVAALMADLVLDGQNRIPKDFSIDANL